jgi:hypothetical protein
MQERVGAIFLLLRKRHGNYPRHINTMSNEASPPPRFMKCERSPPLSPPLPLLLPPLSPAGGNSLTSSKENGFGVDFIFDN